MLRFTLALVFFAIAGVTNAELIGGVEFPDGANSFADELVSYDPVIKGGQPTAPYRTPNEILGVPNAPAVPHAVSLGDGGSITVRFTNNSLTGSGNNQLDLWIFEVGFSVEDTFVEISKDGSTWFSVGKVFGATSGIDIDAFGFGPGDFFSFVRLTDDTDENDQAGDSVGADIDAVGAISSAAPVAVPEPASIMLAAIGALAIAGCGWRSRKSCQQ